jgi:serine/threonine protein kinase
MIPKRDPPTLKNRENFSNEFNSFIQSCLRKEPQERWTAKELLEHPFIRIAIDKRELKKIAKECKSSIENYRIARLKSKDAVSFLQNIRFENSFVFRILLKEMDQ